MKGWFKKGAYPTESHFSDLMDSYVHKKDDTIEIGSIPGLSEALNGKFDGRTGEGLLRVIKEYRDLMNRKIDSINLQLGSIHEPAPENYRFVNANERFFLDNGTELAEVVDVIKSRHETDDDPEDYYLAGGLIVTFFSESARKWEIWQWRGNPYSEDAESEWLDEGRWLKLWPLEFKTVGGQSIVGSGDIRDPRVYSGEAELAKFYAAFDGEITLAMACMRLLREVKSLDNDFIHRDSAYYDFIEETLNEDGNPMTLPEMVYKAYMASRSVTLTQAEYDALTTKDSGTTYYIVES